MQGAGQLLDYQIGFLWVMPLIRSMVCKVL
jgi:hypothetical protein